MAEFVPIPPIIVALDTNSYDSVRRLIDQTYHLPDELVGYKIPHGITVRHYDKLVPSLRQFGKYVVTDTRFNDYTNKLDEEVTTFLETDLPHESAAPVSELPHAFTLLALREGNNEDRRKMKEEVIPKAHQLGVRIFGIMPPIPIAEGDYDQLASQAHGRYGDARELGIDAIDVPQPALKELRRTGIVCDDLGLIVSRLAREGRSSDETIEYVRKLCTQPDVASIYLGRPLEKWQQEGRKPADFIKACLE